jgi:vesicle-fusing ATPase
MYRVGKNTGGSGFVFSNTASVNQRDFPGSEHGILLDVVHRNQTFTLPARASPQTVPGSIGLTEWQRSWIQVGLGPESFVEIYPFSSSIGSTNQGSIPFAAKIDVEINWARPTNTSPEEFPLEELTIDFLKVHNQQPLAASQPVGLSFRGMPPIAIKIIQMWPLDFESGGETRVPRAVITPNTELAVLKSVPRLGGTVASTRPALLASNFSFQEMGMYDWELSLKNI